MPNIAEPRRCNLHGFSIRVENGCPGIQPWLDRLFDAFGDEAGIGGVISAGGIVKPFDAGEVLRNVTPAATAVARGGDLADVFAVDERFWLVDDRWGICQINLLKRQWRAWLLPTPAADPIRCVERAVLWPLAQLLKMRGLELIPAVSIEKEGWGGLILCPWDLEPEIRRLEVEGYRIVGRDWSVLRAGDKGVKLLGMPALRGNSARAASTNSGLLDLAAQRRLGEALECQAVFIVEPGRRAVTRGRTLSAAESGAILRRAWPMTELPPNRRRPGSAAIVLARHSRCVAVQLSKREADFVQVIESSRRRGTGARKIMVAISPGVRRASQAIKSIRPLNVR